MHIELANPELPSPSPRPSEVERLRDRLDGVVAQLADEFSTEMVARALLVKGTDIILADSGMMQAIWSGQRIVDLLAGRYTRETTNLMISTPNC